MILVPRTGMAVEKRKFSKIPNWRHYLLKTRAKRKKNWQNNWDWLKKLFRNASKPREWFRSKEIGFRTSWSREMLNGVSLLVKSCFKDRIGRGFYIALWPATKNAFTTIIPSTENHGECPDMLPHRRSDRIFTVPRLGHISQDRLRYTWKHWSGISVFRGISIKVWGTLLRLNDIDYHI